MIDEPLSRWDVTWGRRSLVPTYVHPMRSWSNWFANRVVLKRRPLPSPMFEGRPWPREAGGDHRLFGGDHFFRPE